MSIGNRREKAWWVILIIFLFFILFTVFGKFPIAWDFRNNLWGPVSLLTHGQSPYNIDVLFDQGNALWLPMAVGFFSPLGLLPLQQANNLWLLITGSAAVFASWLAVRSYKRSLVLQAVSLGLVFLSPSGISHLVLGQFSFIAMMIYLVVVYYRNNLPVYLTALLLALALTKPQLGVLVVLGLLAYMVSGKGIGRTLQFLILLVSAVVLLSFPLFVIYPDWIPDFLIQWNRNPSWNHPSSMRLLQLILPEAGLYLWLLLAAGATGVNFWHWRKGPPEEAVLWSLALTTIVTPYIWAYDFILILPLFLSRLHSFHSRNAVLTLSFVYLVSWVFMAWLRISGASDFSMWWVPWLFLAGIVTAGFLEKSDRQADKA